jgi:hypothetical protein
VETVGGQPAGRNISRRLSKEQDLDDEIAAHLAIEVKQRIEAGETPEDAEHSARRQFGNLAVDQRNYPRRATVYPPSMLWPQMFTADWQPVSRIAEIPTTQFGVVDTNYLRITCGDTSRRKIRSGAKSRWALQKDLCRYHRAMRVRAQAV